MAASGEELGLETPEVDRVEQLTPAIDDVDEPAPGVDVAISETLDADEADVLEQAIGVPDEEEYPSGAG
jgi:hypothetical protein